MEFDSQICTTEEQSKRLLALGLKKETADMTLFKSPDMPAYPFDYAFSHDTLILTNVRYVPMVKGETPFVQDGNIPAWSLHRLIEMIPTTVPDKSYIMHQLMIDGASISYYYFGEEESWEIWRIWNDKELYDNVIDCIKWLIGEGHFDKEYLEE